MTSLFFSTILLFTLNVQAKIFSNSYVSFELPANWVCKSEGFEYTCVNKFSEKQKKAIIILTAKKKGPHDSLKNYETHLKKSRQMKNYKAKTYYSKKKIVKKRKISGVDWIDAIHLGGEVETYYTRYTATTVNALGILVTFSAHKDHYSKYSNDFIKAIQSLKVIASPDLASSKSIRGVKKNIFETGLSDILPDGIAEDLNDSSNDGVFSFNFLGSKGLIGILLLLLTGLGVFIYIRSR